MRAIVISRPGGPEVLELREVPSPALEPAGVLVRVSAAGVNRADLLQRRGRYPAPPGAPADIPGLEFVGTVEAVGDEAEAVRPGDRVMGLLPGGGYAELVHLPADQAIPVPERLTDLEAAAVPEAFITAWDALVLQAGLAAGESVLIHGAGGGVGTAAIQIARLAGTARVFATASAGKLEALEQLGLVPDVPIDYRREAFEEVIARETAGRGVDVILDVLGAGAWEANVRSLALRGRLVLVGLLEGARAEVDLGTLMRKRARVFGTVLRSRLAEEKAELAAAFRRVLLPAFEDGRLRPVVDRTFPLEDAAAAHRYMEERRNVGRIVLEL